VLRRPEAVGDLLQLTLPVLMAGLQDKDDSVQAAAAEALVPLAPMLLQMPGDEVSTDCLGTPAPCELLSCRVPHHHRLVLLVRASMTAMLC
jgi:hypothetical protein